MRFTTVKIADTLPWLRLQFHNNNWTASTFVCSIIFHSFLIHYHRGHIIEIGRHHHSERWTAPVQSRKKNYMAEYGNQSRKLVKDDVSYLLKIFFFYTNGMFAKEVKVRVTISWNFYPSLLTLYQIYPKNMFGIEIEIEVNISISS